MVILKADESVLKKASVYLEERFEFLGSLDRGTAFQVNEEVVATLGVDNDLGLFVLYMDNPLTKSSVSFKIESHFGEIKNQFYPKLFE